MRKHIAIGLISAAIISYQLVIMQILSFTQWHHFGFMVISVALLGFGAAGTYLSLKRVRLVKNARTILPGLIILSGFFMLLAIPASQIKLIRFDSFLVFSSHVEKLKLIFTYLTYFLPFFTGALAIGIFFVQESNKIGKAYFSNLTGSALGGMVTPFLMWILLPQQIPAIIVPLTFVGAILITPRPKRTAFGLAVLLGFALAVFFLISPPKLTPSEFKDLTKTINLPDAHITFEKSSPFGIVHVVRSPVLRYAPGLSLSFEEEVPVTQAIFTNGNLSGSLPSTSTIDSTYFLRYTTLNLPYMVFSPERILIMKAGEGTQLYLALNHNIKSIVAVDQNPLILDVITNKINNGNLIKKPSDKVSFHCLEPRTFLMKDTSQYDLIILPVMGSFGGTSGAYAINEEYLFTLESFMEMWNKLSPHGAVCISTWMDVPLRYPLKILATLVNLGQEKGISNINNHIISIRSWNTITFLLTKKPAIESSGILEFCEKMYFDPVLLPDVIINYKDPFNEIQDFNFQNYVEEIMATDNSIFLKSYDFNISPATDQRPYFSQFLKWKTIPKLSQTFGNQILPFFEVGYFMLILTLGQILIIALVLILFPLLLKRLKSKNKTWVAFYFGGIGLGYMFVEIVLIQQMILYLGNVIYAVAAVISGMLLFSGIGSYMSQKIVTTYKSIFLILLIITGLLILIIVFIAPILQVTMGHSWHFKLMVILAILAPVSFFMGMPFPLGISYLSRKAKNVIPWAWGINGYLSVVSVPMATIIAIESGFSWVMIIAGSVYFVTSLVSLRLKD